MNNSIFRFFVIFSISIFLGSIQACNRKADLQKIEVNSGFSNYISAFTSGIVSSNSTVKVVLIEPNAQAKIGEAINLELFDFEPEIEGTAFWLDEQTIEFRPATKLESGAIYLATFNLGKLQAVSEEFEELQFGFQVISQSIFVSFNGLRTIDATDFSKQELIGSVRTSDVSNPIELEQCFKATQNGSSLEFTWQHDANGKTHGFVLKNVVRTDKEGEVEISWNGDAIGASVDDYLQVRIPPIGEFTLVQASTLREPSLHFSLQFSDPLNENQDLTGLVHLESKKRLRFVIKGNEIKAFPIDDLGNEEVIVIEKSVTNSLGQNLQEEYIRELQFNLEKPAVELLGNGVIMPSNGNLNFPFKAINLKAVNLRVIRIFENNINQFFQDNQLSDYSELKRVGRIVYDESIDLISSEPIDYSVWNNFSVDLGSIIKPEQGAIYRVLISFERYQSLYPCSDEYGEAVPFKRASINWDDNDYYGWNSWYNEEYSWSDRDNPCTPTYYMYYDRAVGANVLASNIGLIAKEAANNTFTITATDLRSTDPLKGLEVELYNFQNQLVGTGKTNGDGITTIASSGKPYLVIAKNGKERGYLRVDNGSALSVSLYNVNGVKTVNGVKGFLYAERGVWRPGDTVHLNVIIEDELKTLPKNHPVILEFYDPLGKLFEKKVATVQSDGIYNFKLLTDAESPTGMWRAVAKVGNSEFSKSIKIETVKPNRIQINIDAGGEVVSATNTIQMDLNANWLYGAVGSYLEVASTLTFDNLKTTFKNFEDYQFDDRSRSFYFEDELTAQTKTNAEGNGKLSFNFDQPNNAPGMLKMKLATKVFESGGDFSQDFMSLKYSPYSSYVGLKIDAGKNWLNAINSEKPQAVYLAAVNEFGKPITREVEIELYELSWNWWYENNESEITRYISRSSNKLRLSDEATIVNGKLLYELNFPEPDWGHYGLRIIDKVSGHSAMETFYVSYDGWRTRDAGAAEAAAMLNLESSKKAYSVGEEIEVTVPSTSEGRIYVSVEKGDVILQQFWVDPNSGSTTFTLEATKEMAPNVYISAFLLQPHGQTNNDLPIRMYGVLPIEVTDENTKLNPQIQCNNEIAPETEFTVQVSEQNSKAMSYTLAIVDEGLLSLTRFKTPNPWNHFYAKEALGIRSWDMYKYVIDAQTGKLTALLATGGDENLLYKGDEKANRFKPVVLHLGPYKLEKGKTNTHQLKLPNYIGQVRVMVVAAKDGAYGSQEKQVKVNQPLMLLTTLPRVLGPNETVKIPVNVIALKDNIKNVKVELATNDLLVPTEKTKQVSFTKAGEQIVYFECKVAQKLGVAKATVTVSSGSEKAYESIEVQVRPPNPAITRVENAFLQPNETWEHAYDRFGIRGTNSDVLQISNIPDLDFQKHLNYLIRYPHGCIEQTTSGAFPQLFLEKIVELTDNQKVQVAENVQAALNKLRSFQLTNGGFGYWPGQKDRGASVWGTNYAGHFMLEAQKLGYEIPAGVLDLWVKYQKEAATLWAKEGVTFGVLGNDLTQAYRLYTLALANQADLGAMNRLRNDATLSNAASWRLAAAYAIIGRTDVAQELANVSYDFSNTTKSRYNYGSTLRDLAMVLETMVYLENFQSAAELTKDIARELNSGWHSTQTRSYALVAIARLIGNHSGGPLKASVAVNGNTINYESAKSLAQFIIDSTHVNGGKVQVTNLSGGPLFVSFVQTGTPLENDAPKLEDDLKLTITYTDLNGNSIDVKQLKQGTDFKARITITHPGTRADYNDIALSQLFPSGWQIVNSRVGESEAVIQAGIDYQDIRDDRMYTYFDLNRSKTLSFNVLLNATFVGKYYMPSVFCAPMYDESVKAQIPGTWVEVVQ